MKKEFLESLGGEMFASFSADEASVIAGNARYTVLESSTANADGTFDVDAVIDWPEQVPAN